MNPHAVSHVYTDGQVSIQTLRGRLTVESGERPALFEGFLVTEDGRGELFANKTAFTSNVIEFTGTGPPPFAT